jgi:hypothetical protein
MPPKQQSERAPRLRRAPTPSSRRAVPTARRVKKPTNRAVTSAVTRALVGATALAQVQEEPVSEVIQEQGAAEPVVEPAPAANTASIRTPARAPVVRPQEPFSYTLMWRVTHEQQGQDVTSDLHTQQSNMAEDTIAKVKEMEQAFERDYPHYRVVKRVYKAGHATVSEKNWQSTSHLSSYHTLIERCAEFNAASKRGISILVETSVVMADEPEGALGTQQPPRSSQRSSAPRSHYRNVTTNATRRQISELPAARQQLEVAGNFAGGITANWKCGIRACNFFHKGLCYWTVSNSVENHVPIIPAVLTAWSEGIRDGRLDVDEPTNSMYGLMMAAKQEYLLHAPRKRETLSGGGGSNSFVLNMSPSQAPVITPSFAAEGPSRSSPVRMPSGSPELSTIEKVDTFIAWCKVERCWRGEEAELDDVRIQIREHGESVDGIGNATVEEWRLLGMKIGYRKRLRTSVKKWMAAGMPAPGNA